MVYCHTSSSISSFYFFFLFYLQLNFLRGEYMHITAHGTHFLQHWLLNPGSHTCWARALPLAPIPSPLPPPQPPEKLGSQACASRPSSGGPDSPPPLTLPLLFPLLSPLLFLFIYFMVQTQGFMCKRQVLYCWAASQSPGVGVFV